MGHPTPQMLYSQSANKEHVINLDKMVKVLSLGD